MPAKKIVILGAGFGGLYTYLYLRKYGRRRDFNITLINRNNYFLFTPMLHEVATGGLNPHHVIESIRWLLRKYPADLCQLEVRGADLKRKMVWTNLGGIPYDYLVIALGATTNFYDVPGAEEYALDLKNLQDAVRIRSRIIDSFEIAAHIDDPIERKKLLTFVIVGGGATGVELAGELVEFFYDTILPFYGKRLESQTELYLLTSGPALLERFHPYFQKKSEEILRKKGVRVITNCAVKEIEDDAVLLTDGKIIPARTAIWVAGVAPHKINLEPVPELDNAGRIITDDFLRIKGYTDAFALGDIASVKGEDGRPLPMFAQVAVREAKILVKNILNSLKSKPLVKFHYKHRGNLISVGEWMALGEVAGFRLSGKFMWWLWRTVYLFKFGSWSKRLKIALDWTINLFSPRDISKLE